MFLRVRKQERVVAGDSFAEPLVVITGPADDVAPPLMGDFVEGNDVSELFLAGGGQASAFLGLLGKKRKCGEIEKARPALSEGSGNLRNTEVMKGEWAGELFVEMDGGINLASKLFQSVGRARSGWSYGVVWR